ncbi:MAG TPA: hypothetical protein VL856_11555 [Acidimicrobiia bacterium]|jgi:hypothetical protein|nr:hypothetical protein [Acidimicrobiia bacterium]
MDAQMRYLRFAALFYALGLGLHTVDHVRRGLDVLTPEVQWAGNLSTAVGIATVALVLIGNRFGPLAAALTGIPVGVGVAAVHLLPHWSAFSDAFPGSHGAGVTAMSWTVVLIEIVGAIAMGVIGLRIVLERRVSPS